jgi:predicted nucleic acid-binding protein
LKVYADTSFLISLYFPDANSEKAVLAMQDIQDSILVTPFGELELCNAMQLQVFRKKVTRRETVVPNRTFESDLHGGVFSLQPMPSATFEIGKRLALKHTAQFGTRTLDIMHVASAISLGVTTFLSFDRNQRKLAHSAGLTPLPATI